MTSTGAATAAWSGQRAAEKKHVSIIGGGIGGLCAAWALARRGHEVAVFDRGPIPNPHGASFDEHRIIRHAYGSMRGYALMMPAAFTAWERLWRDLGRSQYVEAPATYCLRMESDWYRHVSACLDEMGVPYRDVPTSEVAERLPMVNRAGLLRVVETRGAGLLLADRIVRDLADLLPRLGVTLHQGHEVTALDPERGRWRMGAADWAADVVIVAAGAWIGKLLGELPERLRPSVQTVAYLEPPAALAERWRQAPLLLNRLPVASGGVYVLPPRAGTRLKIGDYDHTFTGDPGENRVVRPEHLDRLIEAAHRALDGFDNYRVIEAKSCFYTVTADERFVLRPLGAKAWLLSACSGHGFKFGALIGEAAADAVDGSRSAEEVAEWVSSRLAERPSATEPGRDRR
jgi:glycine/D-amino acid oxidase-like deaminating enzyme